MERTMNVEFSVAFERKGKARKIAEAGPAREVAPDPGRVPRISRLLALAILFEGLVASGQVSSYAQLARLGRVTRARLSQIMSLLNLAPDIQEEVLALPRTTKGRAPLILADLLPIAQEADWRRQRAMCRGTTLGKKCDF